MPRTLSSLFQASPPSGPHLASAPGAARTPRCQCRPTHRLRQAVAALRRGVGGGRNVSLALAHTFLARHPAGSLLVKRSTRHAGCKGCVVKQCHLGLRGLAACPLTLRESCVPLSLSHEDHYDTCSAAQAAAAAACVGHVFS